VVVCFCITNTEKDIKSAISGGAHTVDQVGDRCGAGTGCGSCREQISELLESAGASCPGRGQCSTCPRSHARGASGQRAPLPLRAA